MKRPDLQALRGVAILLVVLFHLQPETFSFGFVGVDIFFVLSGYLMALILSKEILSKGSLLQFYSRRFRRIVPLYYLIVTVVYIATTCSIIHPDKKQLLTDVKWVLAFLENIQSLFGGHDYWDQVNDTRFLTHCWSLAVEIQFYLIAPFIIFASHQYSLKTRNILLLFLIFISCFSQIFTPAKVSFGLLSSRVWQFLLGILCFQECAPSADAGKYEKLEMAEEQIGERNQDEHYENHWPNNVVIIFLAGLTLWNPDFSGKEHVARIVCSLLAAYIISSDCSNPGPILTNRVLVFFGDISYTMYLIHWPNIVFYKYYHGSSLSAQESVLLFAIIFVATCLIYYIIEKPLITFSFLPGLLICVACLLFICLTSTLYLNYPIAKKNRTFEDKDVDKVIQWNIAESEKMLFQLPGDADNVTDNWTRYRADLMLCGQDYSNGSLKVLVIGNSIGYRAFPLIHELFQGRYRELRLYAKAGAVPLVNLSITHRDYTAAAHEVVERMKPDIIWIIYGTTVIDLHTPFNGDSKLQDEIFQQFQNNINLYSAAAKEVVIDLPYYWGKVRATYQIAQRFYTDNYDLSDLRISRKEAEEQQFFHKRRLLALNCKNCRFHDVEQKLFEKGTDTYWLFNRTNFHGYTNDGYHLTLEMLHRFAPLYKETIESMLKKYSGGVM